MHLGNVYIMFCCIRTPGEHTFLSQKTRLAETC